jgi:2-polyprenyl-3-methyl-5-hydroxy-6-metoxy-1,4-benzoquinol methylase
MSQHVCPVWVGYLLLSPVRKLITNPDRILRPYVRSGMTVLDAGTAMGFFSLPLARLVGESGHVVCVDLQEKMIASVKKRAAKAGLDARMEYRVCTQDSLAIDDLAGTLDFAIAIAVVHEVPDARRFLTGIFNALKKGGSLLFSEPAGHVSGDEFNGSLSLARAVGFDIRETRKIIRSHSALLTK